MKNLFLTIFVLILSTLNRDLFACAVCNDMGNESSAYMWATGFLLMLPFILIGILAYWIYKKYKKSDDDIDRERSEGKKLEEEFKKDDSLENGNIEGDFFEEDEINLEEADKKEKVVKK